MTAVSDGVRLYAAYGSNLNRTEMAARCPGATVAGWGWLPGYRLVCAGRPAASYLTVEPDAAAVIPVGLWWIPEADWPALDDYEDYPTLYDRFEWPLRVCPVAGDGDGRDCRPPAGCTGGAVWVPSAGCPGVADGDAAVEAAGGAHALLAARTVWIYQMRKPYVMAPPSADYIDSCAAGYAAFGFEATPLQQAFDPDAFEATVGR